MKKKLTAAVLSVVMLLMSGSVFAAGTETAEESKYSGEYGAFEQMAKYVAERYIDDSLTEEEIMKQGLSKLLENNDPLLVQLLKSMLESLDDYSEFLYIRRSIRHFRIIKSEFLRYRHINENV